MIYHGCNYLPGRADLTMASAGNLRTWKGRCMCQSAREAMAASSAVALALYPGARPAGRTLPADHPHYQPQLAYLVHMLSGRERPRRDLAGVVVRPVDHLHGGPRRVVLGRPGCPLSDIPRACGPVDRIIAMGPLVAKDDEPAQPAAIQL
jgi:hypothetical protein